MGRLLTEKRFLLCGLLPFVKVEEISFEKYKEARGLFIEDPWERVKSIFSKDDYGNIHPELKNSYKMAELGLVVGSFYGGTLGSVKRSQNFLYTSDAKMFQNLKTAYRMFGDENLLGFFNGAVKYAPSFAVFMGGFTLISSCCAAYRNRPSIIDSIVGGFGIGALCKFYFGIKGMISGGIVGGVLGTIHGILMWGVCKLSNKDQLELKYAQFAYSQYREQLLNHKVLPKTEFDNFVEKSGAHERHVIDPLNFLETEENQAENNNIVEEPESK